MDGSGQVLNLFAQAVADAGFFVRAFPGEGFLQAALVKLQKGFQRGGRQINPFAFDGPKIAGGQDLVVKQIERQAIDDGMAEFFDHIQRQRGPAIDGAVQEAEIRIEAVGEEQGKDFVGEQAVAEAEHGVDRIFGRPARAGCKGQLFAKHLAESAEIGGGGEAFSAHEAVDGLQALQAFQRVVDDLDFPRKGLFRMAELVPLDDSAAVANFGLDQGAGKIHRKALVEVALILGQPQKDIFGIGGEQAAAQLAVAGEKGDVDAFLEQGVQGLGGELHVAEDDEALQLEQRNGFEPLVVFGNDEMLRGLAHDGAGFGQVDGGHGHRVT